MQSKKGVSEVSAWPPADAGQQRGTKTWLCVMRAATMAALAILARNYGREAACPGEGFDAAACGAGM